MELVALGPTVVAGSEVTNDADVLVGVMALGVVVLDTAFPGRPVSEANLKGWVIVTSTSGRLGVLAQR